jgi:hypothetical protein
MMLEPANQNGILMEEMVNTPKFPHGLSILSLCDAENTTNEKQVRSQLSHESESRTEGISVIRRGPR